MKIRTSCAMAALALSAAGCNSYATGPVDASPPITTASADLRDASGRSMGTATLTQDGDSLRLRVAGMNLPSGAHGVHIHQIGSCNAPDFTSAGAHWNPGNAQHGKDNPAGMHMGDLPNILIGADGQGGLEYRISSAWLSGRNMPVLDADGAALVVHAAADDYRTDPSGQSGARIACGIFR